MKPSKLKDNNKLKQEINDLKKSLRAVIHTDQSQQGSKYDLNMLQFQKKKQDKKSAREPLLIQKSQKKKLKLKQASKDQSRSKSQTSQRTDQKQPSLQNTQPNLNQKSDREDQKSNQPQESQKEKTQQIAYHLSILKDIKKQLKTIYQNKTESSNEETKEKQIYEKNIPKEQKYDEFMQSNQKKLKEQTKTQKVKKKEQKKEKKEENKIELYDMTDEQLRSNIDKEIEELYDSINLLKGSQSVSQEKSSKQQKKYQSQEQNQISKAQLKEIEKQIDQNQHSLENFQIYENRNDFSQAQQNPELEEYKNSKKDKDLYMTSLSQEQNNSINSSQLQYLQPNKQNPEITNHNIRIQEELTQSGQPHQVKIDDFYKTQGSLSSQFNTRNNQLLSKGSQQNNQVSQSSSKGLQFDIRDKYIQSSTVFEQNLVYEINCLREENKKLRQKLRQVEDFHSASQTRESVQNVTNQQRRNKIKLPYQSDSESDQNPEENNKLTKNQKSSSRSKSRSKSPLEYDQRMKSSVNQVKQPNLREKEVQNVVSSGLTPRGRHCKFCSFLLSKGFSTASCMFHGNSEDFTP